MNEIRIAAPVREILNSHLMSHCEQKIADMKNMLDELTRYNQEWAEGHGAEIVEKKQGKSMHVIMHTTQKYQLDKIKAFEDFAQDLGKPFIHYDPEELRNQLADFVSQNPKTKKAEQGQERFSRLPEDSWWLKALKSMKAILFRLTRIPATIANLFRKLFRKNIRRIAYWKYRLPLRTLLAYQLENKMLKNLDTVLSGFSQSLVLVAKSALDKEQISNKFWMENCLNQASHLPEKDTLTIDLSEEYNQLEEIYAELNKSIDSVISQHEQAINDIKLITGTIEYPTTLLKYRNRKSSKESVEKSLVRTNIGWGNTAFALMEDWKIDQEIYSLATLLRQEITLLEDVFGQNNNKVTNQLLQGRQKIEEVKGRFLEKLVKSKPNHISSVIKEELKKLDQGSIKTILEPAVSHLIQQNFSRNVNKFEVKIHKSIAEISEKRWLTKLTEYNTPLKRSDLDSFSPNELISFKQLPELEASCSKLKSQNIRKVEAFKQDIYNIENIIAFNLNTILESLDTGTSNQEKAKEMIIEGVERSENKLKEIVDSLDAYEKEMDEKLEEILKQFNESAMQLTNNENAFNLRIAVTKAKALKRTEEVKTLFIDKARLYYFKTKEQSIQRFEKIRDRITPWLRRMGIHGNKPYIATELSDFLSEAHSKINSLPIVYQQLYKIQPLTEMSLFTGRGVELEQLIYAHKSWKDGKYAPTVILGEKWSGHTTLINYFLSNNADPKNVIYENRLINIHSPMEFIEAWQKILGDDSLGSLNEIIDLLNSKHKNKIIVIENLQNYYVRTIKGFESLNLMIQLISKTYHKVFWLCSANIYAWDYLNNTIEIANYFAYHIKMTAFTDEELRELIMKKNNISGYRIIFQPAQKNLESNKFNKMNPAEKQDYLRDQFFNQLNGFAKGNISLALSYWLLSTNKITEESIEINNFESPDFSFINNLKTEKVFVLYILIMHDGLTLNQLSEVYKKPIDKLHLLIIMLLDDGILVDRNGWFEVNPIIYRQSINMLKAKNLIY